MFDFIKKFFKKEEEIIEKVAHSELRQWFLDKVKDSESVMKAKLKDLKKEISQNLSTTHEKLDNLENAELMNKNIEVKEKQFMDGNRRAYVQKTRQFLREIEDILEHEVNFLVRNYEEYMQNLTKSTSRSYMILQEFFANEAKDIAISIKKIDRLIDRLKNDKDVHNFTRIEKINKEFISIENNIKKKGELKEEIKKLDSDTLALKEKEKNLIRRKQEIRDSDEYKDVIKLEAERKEKEKRLKGIKDKLYFDFSSIDRPLRKYQRIAYQNGKLIEYYSSNATSALTSDSNLNILNVFDGMLKAIKEGKLELKDKQADKAVNMIKKMDRKYFEDFKEEYTLLREEIDKINSSIKANKTRPELESIEEKLEVLNNKKDILKNRHDEMSLELEGININHMREKLKEDIEKVLGVKIDTN